MKLSCLTIAFGLAASALTPNLAEAADCFILVHGNKADNLYADRAKALAYWTADGDFTQAITGGATGAGHYAIVGWNSSTSMAIPFWHPDAAGQVASQIVAIEAGQGDGISHTRQCTAGDNFYVVAHSQGAQVMTYINGNAKATDPNANAVINAIDVSTTAGAVRSYAPFSSAMSKVTAVITVGGAINGTQGMDNVCNGGLDAALLAVMGKTCVKSLQTYSQYNPSSFTGSSMYRPMYSLGGHGTTPISLAVLSGEDDGVVNLASQMNCTGSPSRDLEKDLKEWWFGVAVTFTCNSANKRHANNFNLASVNITHNAEVGAASGTFSHEMNAAGVLNCGNGKNVPNTIAACLSLTK